MYSFSITVEQLVLLDLQRESAGSPESQEQRKPKSPRTPQVCSDRYIKQFAFLTPQWT